MRYMFLIYNHQPQTPSPPDPAVIDRVWRLIDEAKAKGIFEAAEPLFPVNAATTLRRSGDQVMMTDGPYAETKEQLAGYYILDCRDLDEALQWAARIPICQSGMGSIEVRPIAELPAR